MALLPGSLKPAAATLLDLADCWLATAAFAVSWSQVETVLGNTLCKHADALARTSVFHRVT